MFLPKYSTPSSLTSVKSHNLTTKRVTITADDSRVWVLLHNSGASDVLVSLAGGDVPSLTLKPGESSSLSSPVYTGAIECWVKQGTGTIVVTELLHV